MVIQMYREPRVSIMDRHVLIELDGDFTDYEIGHLLRKAYENHKAPHEYDDLKKYIRDMVIGKHNSVYQQYGTPITLAAAAILMPSNTLNWTPNSGGIPYDGVFNHDNYGCGVSIHTFCQSTPAQFGQGIPLITYNNGTAVGWVPLYLNTAFQNLGSSCPSSGSFVVVQPAYNFYPNYVAPSYSYAPYITSANPITLSTYYSWTYPSSWSAASYSYVYFTILLNTQYGSNIYAYINLFYTTGTFNFNPGTAYITMWQWTYQ